MDDYAAKAEWLIDAGYRQTWGLLIVPRCPLLLADTFSPAQPLQLVMRQGRERTVRVNASVARVG